MSFLKKFEMGRPAAERQMLHVHEQVFTDLVDERKDVYRRDGFRDQGNKDKTNLTPGQRCLGLSPDKRGPCVIGTVRQGSPWQESERGAPKNKLKFVLAE
jgi:hypothetical protein